MQKDIQKALQVIREGGIILYPTDTIWGLGCDACNSDAVKRIYQIKKRNDNKNMLCLIDTPSKLDIYVEEVPEVAWDLVETAQNPLTVIYPNAKNVASNLLSEDGFLGIRVANDLFCQKLISRLRNPLVSTSANISGEPSPNCFNDISDDIINAVDYIVEYRQDDYSTVKASSIIKLELGGLFKIIRE